MNRISLNNLKFSIFYKSIRIIIIKRNEQSSRTPVLTLVEVSQIQIPLIETFLFFWLWGILIESLIPVISIFYYQKGFSR